MPRQDQYLEKLRRVPMFQACSKKDIVTISRAGDPLAFTPGQTLVREGERGREFFIIIDGKLKVERQGTEVATLGPGDYFGELALLDPGPRDATVTAVTHGEVLVIGQPQFHAVLAEVPSIAGKLMVGMARRLHEADHRPVR